jgi:hypothetical protein
MDMHNIQLQYRVVGDWMFTYDDILKQEEALLQIEKKRYFITVSSRPNQKLSYDDSNKSYAFWYDNDDIKRIMMGTRNYHTISYMRYV